VGQVTGLVYRQYIVAYGVISFVALIVLWSSEQVGCRLGRMWCEARFEATHHSQPRHLLVKIHNWAAWLNTLLRLPHRQLHSPNPRRRCAS